jgi:hypothetical protein
LGGDGQVFIEIELSEYGKMTKPKGVIHRSQFTYYIDLRDISENSAGSA